MSQLQIESENLRDIKERCQKNKSQVNLQAKYSLKALLYKSLKIQQRNYCSNICQIITPLLCIAFTLLAQLISNQILSSKIQSFDFPQPLDFPYFYTFSSSLNLSCQQNYVYQYLGQKEQKYQINQLLNHTLKYYCQNTDSLMPEYVNTENVNKYLMDKIKTADTESFERGNDLTTNLPDGFCKFKSVSERLLNVTYGVNDLRLPEYHKNNGVTKIAIKTGNQQLMSYLRVTQGMMTVMQKINRAFLQLSNPKQIIMGSVMYMPFDGQDKSLKNKVINIIGAGLYPLGLCLLLPLFLYAIVNQKQQKLIQIMKMNGLNVKYYWVSSFIFNYGITSIMLIIFYSFGRFYLQLTLFVETSAVVFWLLLLGWGIALISMTNLVQIFINSAKSATIIGYLLSIFSCFVGEAITTFIYAYPQSVPLPILFYPPFALCRAIYLIGFNCASNSSCYKDINHIDRQFSIILLILYGWFVIYILSIWLNEMIQQQYGVAHYPDFIKKIVLWFKKQQVKKIQLVEENYGQKQEAIENAQIQMSQSTKFIIQDPVNKLIDESVFKINQIVSKSAINSKPMIIKCLSKKYQTLNSTENKNYTALKPLTLYMEKKQIFGLLGPNGAGKTTMISVLTGMYPQTSGNAWINGHEIGNSSTNKYIGVCPQFDLLWPDLTVYQHLKFYSILKMVKSEFIQVQIQQLLKDVDLQEWKDTPSSQLSGGMQRRLSLAISLVGNPNVVFLDEPSSGLDPSHRRQMWNILLKCKKRTSILLTTHLMQQAQVLCDRVGIISKGQLRCIGKIDELKQKFGQGYRLTINYSGFLKKYVKRVNDSSKNESRSLAQSIEPSQNEFIRNETYPYIAQSTENMESSQIQQTFRPEIVDKLIEQFDAQIVNQLNTRTILKIDKQSILKCVQILKNQVDVNWLVSQPSLYDVFVHFIK